MSYTDVHSFILRSVASRKVLTLEETEDAIKKYLDNIQDVGADIIREANIVKQLVKITKDEITDENILMFFSIARDNATKSQNFFSVAEYEFLQLLLKEIMTEKDRQISETNAMNLVGKINGSLTETDIQSILNTFSRMHYLDKMDTQYALGVRAIHEFEGYLKDNLPGTIQDCTLCKESVFRSRDCPACGVSIHIRCLNRHMLNSQKWPCCNVDVDMNPQWLSESHTPQNKTNEEVSHVDDEMDVT